MARRSSVGVLGLLGVCTALGLSASAANAAEPVFDINIPSQDAAASIEQLAVQTGAITIFPYDLAAGQQANAVIGRYTLAEALELLLQGTNLSGDLRSQSVISISRRDMADGEGEGEELRPTNNVPLARRIVRTIANLFSADAMSVRTQTANRSSEVSDPVLEEIVVTARKRVESLQEVPVAVSVLSDALIVDAGVLTVDDIYNLIPGADYARASNGERYGSTPSIRGVRAGTGISNTQKVNAFVDGLPMIGSQGTQRFSDIERIEVLRGPQSSSFGRAVFAGAINYVTKDPGNEFEGTATLNVSDIGRKGFTTFLGGPLSDTWGYTFSVTREDVTGPDDWVSTEGVRLGGERTAYVSGKLKWTPTDWFDAEFRYLHIDTDDDSSIWWRYNSPGNAGLDSFDGVLYEDTPWAQCANTILPNGNYYIIGEFNCSSDVPRGGVPLNMRPSEGPIPPGLTREELRLHDMSTPGVFTDRHRFQAEFNVALDAGSLQVLTFTSEDEQLSWRDNDLTNLVTHRAGGNDILAIANEGNPAVAEENYIEVRWLSPDEGRRLRWLIGASFYKYDFFDLEYDHYIRIVADGEDIPADGSTTDNVENFGVFGSVEYDVSDRLTVSIEGRQQRDQVTNTNEDFPPVEFTTTTETFQPRLSANYALNESTTIYVQVAKGSNPGGTVPDTQTLSKRELSHYLFDAGLIGFTTDSFLNFPEETMTNYEVGLKGTLADNRVSFATALYFMDWGHYNQRAAIEFDPFQLAADAFAEAGSMPGSNWDPAGPDGDSDPGTGGTNAYEDLAAFHAGGNSAGAAFRLQDGAVRGLLDQGNVDVYGLEAEAAWRVNDYWDFRGTLTLQNTGYKNYCSQQAVEFFGQNRTNTAGDGSGVVGDCVDVSGNELSYQSGRIGSLGASYRNSLFDSGWNWSARLDWTSRSRQYVDHLNWMYLPARETFNGSLRFADASGNLVLAITGRNLADDRGTRSVRYTTNSFTLPRLRDPSLVAPFPRELGASFTYNF